VGEIHQLPRPAPAARTASCPVVPSAVMAPASSASVIVTPVEPKRWLPTP